MFLISFSVLQVFLWVSNNFLKFHEILSVPWRFFGFPRVLSMCWEFPLQNSVWLLKCSLLLSRIPKCFRTPRGFLSISMRFSICQVGPFQPLIVFLGEFGFSRVPATFLDKVVLMRFYWFPIYPLGSQVSSVDFFDTQVFFSVVFKVFLVF